MVRPGERGAPATLPDVGAIAALLICRDQLDARIVELIAVCTLAADLARLPLLRGPTR
jgi:hypothetical protein